MKQKYFDILIENLKNSDELIDIPVSALIIDDQGKVVSIGFNTRHSVYEISGHAEINSINQLTRKIKSLNLASYTLLTTLEPCQMCYGAIKQSKIKRVEYILDSFKYGINNIYSINEIDLILVKNSNIIQEKQCQEIMERFFKKIR